MQYGFFHNKVLTVYLQCLPWYLQDKWLGKIITSFSQTFIKFLINNNTLR